ncbi:kynurenine 3-monooxygenase [Prauserella marina]|uniref:Kynurenine 3-monooxygenase n=1 Tax=Prauserella marina TaxID=530584 RepID=A0A222VQW5_9PSEU|nr:NAD(P)/FAD-dependent oxidoreductase [Prauserella marina]ASR36242.1 kynurenine 3-monooxygenase [Prauserella marina]PWV77010.1 kynurenine 3-monooxygenase [Prauserella marina]SDD02326.1 kynurenine 3-monooxygenase [Prauserella marina]
MTGSPSVAIVGAGLTGCLLACYLARRGERVIVYERRADPRLTGPEQGRSINLALSERGIAALRGIGLEDAVLADALPMRGRMIHPVAGELDFQPYSAEGTLAINSISRGALNNVLLTAAHARPNIEIRFSHRLDRFDPASGELRFSTPDGVRTGSAPVVIGADGARSAVRGELVRHGLSSETVDLLDYGYKELTVPAGSGGFVVDEGALHIWPRGRSMMIALPNPDRSFTCTLFWPDSGAGSFAALDTPTAIRACFRENYPDVEPYLPELVTDYQRNPVGVLGTVRCAPWHAVVAGARVVGLLGDAAHAIVPFYGQGANCAFEDVVVLEDCLDAAGGDWPAALALFERRRTDTEAIASMALANFVEMRDKVASPLFKLGKTVEHALERALPGRYVSRYELVSFSTVPYGAVRRRVRRQHQLLGVLGAIGAFGLLGALGALLRVLARARVPRPGRRDPHPGR